MEKIKENQIKCRKLKQENVERLLAWWIGLLERNGPRAQLKRCSGPEEAALIPDTFKVKDIIPPWNTYQAAAAIAGILAHVRKEGLNIHNSFAKQLALSAEGSSRAVFSETRFRQLLSSKNWNEFYTGLRRAVKILNGKANPLYVADIILRWDDENRKNLVQKKANSLKYELSHEYYTQLFISESKK